MHTLSKSHRSVVDKSTFFEEKYKKENEKLKVLMAQTDLVLRVTLFSIVTTIMNETVLRSLEHI